MQLTCRDSGHLASHRSASPLLSNPPQAALLPSACPLRLLLRKAREKAPVPTPRREDSMGFTAGLRGRTVPRAHRHLTAVTVAQDARKALNKTHHTRVVSPCSHVTTESIRNVFPAWEKVNQLQPLLKTNQHNRGRLLLSGLNSSRNEVFLFLFLFF